MHLLKIVKLFQSKIFVLIRDTVTFTTVGIIVPSHYAVN
jgi:hypothetical protein